MVFFCSCWRLMLRPHLGPVYWCYCATRHHHLYSARCCDVSCIDIFCLELDVCCSWGSCCTPWQCACSLARAPSMAWTPCCRNCKGSCSLISFCVCCSYYDDRCCCDPATCSRGDSNCCLTCCGDCHLSDVVPPHGRPSHQTAGAVCDASCISHVAQSDACVSLPGSHLLPAN